MDLPSDYSSLSPYLLKAQQLRSSLPVPSYYFSLYALNLAMKQETLRAKEENSKFLLDLMTSLEIEKKSLINCGGPNAEAMKDGAKARAMVLQMAMKAFLAADNEEREGVATKKTARLFIDSTHFMDVLRVFDEDGNGELPVELEDRIKYARWKASEIIKASKLLQSPAEHVQISSPVAPTSQSPSQSPTHLQYQQQPQPPQYQQPYSPNLQQQSPKQQSLPPQYQQQPPPQYQQPPHLPSMSGYLTQTSPSRNYKILDPKILAEAEKLGKHGVSSIQFDDIPTAIKNFERAISLLQSLQ